MAATELGVSAVIVATRPQLRNDADRVVFALHACFLSAGYVLNATGGPALSDNALASTCSDEEVNMQGWNDSDDGYYAFVYGGKHGKKVLVKCLVVNDKLMVDALKHNDNDDPHHLEITIGDFIGDSNSKNYMSQYKNLGYLVNRVNQEVLTKLSATSSSTTSTEGSGDDRDEPGVGGIPEPTPLQDPYMGGIPKPTLFQDPYVGGIPEPTPLQDPYHPPWIIPPVYPGSGGLHHVGPDDSIFHGWIEGEPNFQGQAGVPPQGARFDPYGPPDVPGFDPNRFARGLPPPPDREQFGDNFFDYK